MQRRHFLAAGLALCAAPAFAQGMIIPKPGPKDLCPVCGMIVSKYPNWVALVTWKDGHSHFFDGAKDMFKFLHDLGKFAPAHRKEDISGIFVTDYYNLAHLDARQAFYVIGSDVLGPMGHELVPLASKIDADDFLKDHKGKKLLSFDQVSPALVAATDAGRF